MILTEDTYFDAGTGGPIAHRLRTGLYSPEMTEVAFNQLPTDAQPEIDVQIDLDGVLWVHHDTDLSSLTGETSSVGDLTTSEMQALRTSPGSYPLMTFERFLQVALTRPAQTMWVELKGDGGLNPTTGWADGQYQEALRLLGVYGLLGRCILQTTGNLSGSVGTFLSTSADLLGAGQLVPSSQDLANVEGRIDAVKALNTTNGDTRAWLICDYNRFLDEADALSLLTCCGELCPLALWTVQDQAELNELRDIWDAWDGTLNKQLRVMSDFALETEPR